ncbi:MAG: ATP-binding protein [Prevotella sp.]|nr:ATP-binding protein [Prevotella sp.]
MLNINGKEWGKLQAEDIIKHLSEGEENTFFEYKEDGVKPEHLVKEISAFANTYGGYIFLGIKDDNTIAGCKEWNEERITTTIFNCLTPTPIYDVKNFLIGDKDILVIKIEEGPMPPYITNKGAMYERVSSSSDKITKSDKLSQLYSKNETCQKKTANRIELPPLLLDNTLPHNLSAYLDFGFEVVNAKPSNLEQNWSNFDFLPISEYLRNYSGFSMSIIGNILNITIGSITPNRPLQSTQLAGGLHNFIEIMQDGSVKGRILLPCDAEFKVDIESIVLCYRCFEKVYNLIFGLDFCSNFIYAKRYEKLTVLKQFSTFYSKFDKDEKLKNYYNQHKAKYGNTLIMNGNRIPSNDYSVVDRRYIESKGLEFNNDNLLNELFTSYYINLGYIDLPKY